jgi:hypothetical protein
MSFITKVTFVPRDNDVKSVSIENIDYGIGKSIMEIKFSLEGKFKEYQFRELNETGSYFDYVTILSYDEFTSFHNKFFQSNNLNNSNKLEEFVKSIDDSIRYNWIIVELFEVDF